jgi:hypothetical protein
VHDRTPLSAEVDEVLQSLGSVNTVRDGSILAEVTCSPPFRELHFQHRASVASDQRALEDATVAELASVASIEVTELRYADGSVWHASPYAQCETPPDNIMLIADK